MDSEHVGMMFEKLDHTSIFILGDLIWLCFYLLYTAFLCLSFIGSPLFIREGFVPSLLVILHAWSLTLVQTPLYLQSLISLSTKEEGICSTRYEHKSFPQRNIRRKATNSHLALCIYSYMLPLTCIAIIESFPYNCLHPGSLDFCKADKSC